MFGRKSNTPDFEQVVRDHRSAVAAFARSLVFNPSSVDDIVQETFIRVWRYLPTFRNEGSLEGWIIRICRNVAYDYMRKNPIETEIVDECEIASQPIEAHTDVMSAIAKLPHDHREVITLCLILGYSYEEASGILNVPIGTVRSRISRARETLQHHLADTYQPMRRNVG